MTTTLGVIESVVTSIEHQKNSSVDVKPGELLTASTTDIVSMNRDMLTPLIAYGTLTIAGVDDKEGIKAVRAAKSELVTARTTINKQREALKEPYLEAGRKIDAVAKEMTALLAPHEQHVVDLLKNVELEAAKIEEKRLDDRLTERGFRVGNVGGCDPSLKSRVRLMSDSEFSSFLLQCAESNRIRREQQEAAAKLEADRKALDAERAEFNRLKSIEDQKQRDIKAEADRAQRLADSAASDEKERLRKEALMPDVELLHVFAAQIELLKLPNIQTDTAHYHSKIRDILKSAAFSVRNLIH